MKGWQLVAALACAGYSWGFIAVAPVARATMQISASLSHTVLAEPQVAAFVTSLELRNGVFEGSAALGPGGSANSAPAAGFRVVVRSMREWQFNNPVDGWLPRLFLNVHDDYFRFSRDVGLRRLWHNAVRKADDARFGLRATPKPLL